MGLATAEALAEEGARVALLARRADVLEREAARLGGIAVPADISRDGEAAAAVERAARELGGLDVLVVNGGGPPPGPAVEVTPETVRASVELLLTSAVALVGAALPYLRESGRGRIVAIESIAAKEPVANLALSNAVRPGVIGWLKTLAQEVGTDGITVNTILPGRIDTERMQQLYGPDGPPPEILRAIPAGRLGRPREVGDVICFLASERASYVSGTTIPVDGGAARGLL
jgi:3-oxoacyl-[acyl-carrier protein] reductase